MPVFLSTESCPPGEARAPRRAGRLAFWPLLALVLLLALGLRSSGLGRDFPFELHCDVPKQVEVLKSQVVQRQLGFLPSGYPAGHMQIASAALEAGRRLAAWIGQPLGLADQDLFLAARLTVLFLGLGGVAALALAGRELFGIAAGLLAGLLWATDRLSFIHGHHAMGDLPQASLAVASFLFTARALIRGEAAPLGWAGFFAGLAAATKYFGGYLLLPALGVAICLPGRRRAGLGRALLGGALGFLLLTPAIWVDPAGWWALFREEIAGQARLSLLSGHDVGGWLAHGLRFSLATWWDDGAPFALGLLPALALLFWRRRPGDRLLAATLGLGLLVVALRARYLRPWDHLILLPFFHLALAASGFKLLAALGPAARPVRLVRPFLRQWPRALAGGFLAVLALAPLGATGQLALLYQLPDTRRQAAEWLEGRLPPALPGQRFLVDMTLPSARELHASDHYYPAGKGYQYFEPEVPSAQACRELLADRRGGEVPYALVHTFRVHQRVNWCQPAASAAAEFKLVNTGEYDPLIQVFELGAPLLTAAWRPLPARALGWESLASATTPAGRREIRELILDGQAVERLLVADPAPEELGVLYRGGGRLVATHGGEERRLPPSSERPALAIFPARPSLPYLVNLYRLRLAAADKPLVVRLLVSPAELAAGCLAAGLPDQALAYWQKARAAGEDLLPQDALALARLLRSRGDGAAADRVLAELEERFPALRPALAALPGLPDGAAALARLAGGLGADPRALAGRGEVFPWRQAQEPGGPARPDPATGEEVVTWPAGRPAAGVFWLPGPFAGGHLRLRLHLRRGPPAGEATGGGEGVRLEVLYHHAHQLVGSLARAELTEATGTGGAAATAWQVVELGLRPARVPCNLEVRIKSDGGREVDLGKLEVLPDPLGFARESLAWPE